MASSLILLEHDGRAIKRSSLCGITLARELGQPYSLLVVGTGLGDLAQSVIGYGAESVLVADHPALAEPLADRYASVVAQAARTLGASTIIGTSSTFTKDVLPRAAALLEAPMVTDVMGVEKRDGVLGFQRPMNAGSLVAVVALESDRRVLAARGTSFQAPSATEARSPVEAVPVDADALPGGTEFVAREKASSDRPDLTEARVVVSGGRPLKDQATFERLIGGLADVLGGAVGATRAAVDAGMVSNDYQVGQTGKVVAPELYIGAGVSGAIQHLAGIQDSRIIVAINRDPDAPLHQVANYSLVGDLHDILPRLIEALRS